MTSWGNPDPAECLEKLRAEIADGDYSIRLVAAARLPHLRVSNRTCGQLTEDIYCDGRSFWWSWAEPIAPVADVAAAAQAVTKVLRVRTAGAGR